MKKKKIIEELIIIFWLFIIGSVIGYILEMIVALIQKGYFESRQGLIYGPFTPVYGAGIIIYYLAINNIKISNKIKIFLITMVLGGTTEYVASFVQEQLFGTVSWDYSHLWFNINGRTSLLHCIYWGIGGIAYIQYIKPIIQKHRQTTIKSSNVRIITILCALFMFLNIGISCVAADRQQERRNNVLPASSLDIFLDKYYPDEVMDKIYANKKVIV